MGEVGWADMITMDHLSEDRLLSNLELRFNKDIIYVRTEFLLFFFPCNDLFPNFLN